MIDLNKYLVRIHQENINIIMKELKDELDKEMSKEEYPVFYKGILKYYQINKWCNDFYEFNNLISENDVKNFLLSALEASNDSRFYQLVWTDKCEYLQENQKNQNQYDDQRSFTEEYLLLVQLVTPVIQQINSNCMDSSLTMPVLEMFENINNFLTEKQKACINKLLKKLNKIFESNGWVQNKGFKHINNRKKLGCELTELFFLD